MPLQREFVSLRRPSFCQGLEIMRAGYLTHRFSKHFHEGYALGFIESGALGFRYRGEQLVAAPGEINLTVPGEVHDGAPAASEGFIYSMLYLEPEIVARAGRELGLKSLPCFPGAVLKDPWLAAKISHTHALLGQPETSNLAKQSLLLDLLCAWINRHAKPGASQPAIKPEPGTAAKLRMLIRERCCEDLRLDDLAKASGLSHFHLIRIFAKAYGLTPHAYLVQARLELAKDMLGKPGKLADLASSAGFSDQSHLTRLFKARYGLTPAAYRNYLQNN